MSDCFVTCFRCGRIPPQLIPKCLLWELTTFSFRKELASLKKSPPKDVEISLPNESQLCEWDVNLTGPDSSPYAGGKFQLAFKFPETYPFKPPSINFTTKIYHPNVKTDTGEICAAILYDEWSPTLNATHCLDVLMNMLKSPSADSPLEEEIAKMLRESPKDFEKKAKQWTKEFAK